MGVERIQGIGVLKLVGQCPRGRPGRKWLDGATWMYNLGTLDAYT